MYSSIAFFDIFKICFGKLYIKEDDDYYNSNSIEMKPIDLTAPLLNDNIMVK